MALPKPRQLGIIRVPAYMADQSTASSAFVRAPCRGKIVEIGVINYAAVTTADNALTAKINGTAITGAAMTSAFTGAAAGDTYSCTPTAANDVVEGDKIEFVSDGAGSGTVPCNWYADIDIN